VAWNDDVSLSHFGTTFDWIVDYNGSRRLQPKALRPLAYERFAAVLTKGGRLLTSPRPMSSTEELEKRGLVLTRRWVFEDCPFALERPRIRWWEFTMTRTRPANAYRSSLQAASVELHHRADAGQAVSPQKSSRSKRI
jgi:hypothetical protein